MDLFAGVESLKGVGPKTAGALKKAGIRTVRDFFYNLPRDGTRHCHSYFLSPIRENFDM